MFFCRGSVFCTCQMLLYSDRCFWLPVYNTQAGHSPSSCNLPGPSPLTSTASRKTNRILAPIGVGLALSLLGDTTLYTVLPNPDIAAEAGLTLAAVGVVLGLNRLIRLLTNGAFGLIYDRRPRRSIMLAGMLVAGLSTISYAVSEGPVLIMIGRVVWGASWSAMWIGANTISLDISGSENRGRVTGQLQMWFYFGVTFSALASGLFTDWLGYRGGLFLSGGLTMLGFLLWLLFLPETRPDPSTMAAPPAAGSRRKPYPWKFMAAVSVPLFAIGFAFFGVVNSTNILWLGQFVDGGIRAGRLFLPIATLSGGLFAGRVLLSTAGAPVIGAVSDRSRRRWIIMAFALLLALAGIVLMSQTRPLAAFTGAILISLMTGGVSALCSALIGDRVAEEWRGRSVGLLYTLRDLGATVGPPIALSLTPLIGLGRVYRLTAGLLAASLLVALVMSVREGRRTRTVS